MGNIENADDFLAAAAVIRAGNPGMVEKVVRLSDGLSALIPQPLQPLFVKLLQWEPHDVEAAGNQAAFFHLPAADRANHSKTSFSRQQNHRCSRRRISFFMAFPSYRHSAASEIMLIATQAAEG